MTRKEALSELGKLVIATIREAMPAVLRNARKEDILLTEEGEHAVGVALAMGAMVGIHLSADPALDRMRWELKRMTSLDLARSGLYQCGQFRQALREVLQEAKSASVHPDFPGLDIGKKEGGAR